MKPLDCSDNNENDDKNDLTIISVSKLSSNESYCESHMNNDSDYSNKKVNILTLRFEIKNDNKLRRKQDKQKR